MMRQILLLMLTGALVVMNCRVGSADTATTSHTVTVQATGEAAIQNDEAAAKAEAIWSAKRNAVEEAGGLLMRSVTSASQYRIVNQQMTAAVQGFIKSWQLVPGSLKVHQLAAPLKGEVLSLRIVAVVDVEPLAKNLQDLQDAYADLNRPSLWVAVTSHSRTAQQACTEVAASVSRWLKLKGFRLAAHEHDAAVTVHISLNPVWSIRMGAANTPYGLGSEISSCTVVLSWRVLETSSQMVLESGTQVDRATSFSSNASAAAKASLEAADKLRLDKRMLSTLLARWTAERYSGYVASIQVVGLPSRLHIAFSREISALRGFMGVRDYGSQNGVFTIHARFRLAPTSLHEAIAALQPGDNFRLYSVETRGTVMLFRAARR